MKLTQEQKIEIRSYENPKWKDMIELAKKFNVSLSTIRYLVNYQGYKERHNAVMMKWRIKNPEKWSLINKRAVKKYSLKRKKKEVEK